MLMNLQCLQLASFSLQFFLVLRGFCFWNSSAMLQQQAQENNPEPVMLSSDHIDHHVRATSSLDGPVSISTATAKPEPTVEDLVMWLIGRCDRRRYTAQSEDACMKRR